MGRLADRNQGFMDILLDPNDGGNTIWITRGRYLYKFDRQTGRMDSTCYDPLDSRSILGSGLKGMYMDQSGMLWIAGNSGINIMVNDDNGIKRHSDFTGQFNDEAVSFLEDSKGFWWIGTSESGLLKFDSNMKLLRWYKSHLIDENSDVFYGSIQKIIEDRDYNLWMICNTDRLYFLDREKDKIIPCAPIKADNFPPKSILDIFEDSKGIIWIAARPGLYYHKPGEGLDTFNARTATDMLRISTSSCIIEDHLSNLWISSLGGGLYCQPSKYRGTEKFVNYIHDPDDSTSLSNNFVLKIYEDNQGRIWVTTNQGLNRYNREEDNFERIIFKRDISANFATAILGDQNGYLWLATGSGLIRFNPEKGDENDDLSHQLKLVIPFIDFDSHRLFKDKSGRILVPAKSNSGNGYFSFHPDSLVENRNIPPIVITNFLIRNEPVSLDSSINVKKHLKLNYNENYLSFEFAALDYTDPQKNQYAYILKGLDDDWIYSGNRRFVTYTKVPPGEYTFRVKGSNNDGYWNVKGTSLVITIDPPPWKTWWAYCLYFLFIFFVLYFILRFYLRRQRLIHKLEMEQVQTEKLKELDKFKSRFFTNISHEFRTPLTLILGPLEKVFSKVKDDESKQDISIAQRNARRLQRLINQLLNLSKLEAGKLKLKASERDAIPIIREYIQSFESLAGQKGIALKFKSEIENLNVWIDQEKFEQILLNLLSNAFKFTSDGGRIEVQVSSQPPFASLRRTKQSTVGSNSQVTSHISHIASLMISISDTGAGILAEKLPHIFDRFYQADDTYTKDQEGTGIGLALTKELVELHHGKIEVESEVGMGTAFRVYLPLGSEHLSSEQIDKTSPVTSHKSTPLRFASEDKAVDSPYTPYTPAGKEDKKTDIPLLLIVEDNTDLRQYIRGYLDQTYNIIEAENGVQGFDRAIEHIPDLVISDVMMPEMDGFELCSKLKTDQRTCHIPVILLTARASSESKIQGLETGADDYLSKPFDPKELQVRIKNLIYQRQSLREKFIADFWKGDQGTLYKIPVSDLGIMDKKFLEKALEVVELHLSDSEFNVLIFGQEMAMSRQQMHRKLRALVNHSATEFIRTIRLNKAAFLLVQKTGTVSEIAYDVGFKTLSYFTKSFQDQFGITPSEYTTHSS